MNRRIRTYHLKKEADDSSQLVEKLERLVNDMSTKLEAVKEDLDNYSTQLYRLVDFLEEKRDKAYMSSEISPEENQRLQNAQDFIDWLSKIARDIYNCYRQLVQAM